MNTEKDKQPEDRLIQDGDSRPDQPVEKTSQDKKSPLASERGRVTKERGADVNSADDFRDARND